MSRIVVSTVEKVNGEGGPRSSCADIQRQLLEFVDDNGSVTFDEFMAAASHTLCNAGHEFQFRDVQNGLIRLRDDARMVLTREGDDWLYEYGRPAVNWAANAPAPALRDWQVDALDAWAAHGRHGVIEAVTGTGKSRVGIEAVREALADGYKAVIAVPTVDLVDQWHKSLRFLGIERVGKIGDGSRASFATHDVIVSTIQSLFPAPPTVHDGKVLLVADECHRYGSTEWRKALHPSYRRRLGLTATFERSDDGLDALLRYFGGSPVYSIGFARAIRDGVVAHYDVELYRAELSKAERQRYNEVHDTVTTTRHHLIGWGFTADPFGVFMREVQEAARAHDVFEIHELAVRYLKAFSERVDILAGARGKVDAVRALAGRVADSRGTILFTSRVDIADRLAAALSSESVAVKAVHSKLTRAERHENLAALRHGRIKALVAPTILDEGIDVPSVDLAIALAGSSSRRQMIQRMGRALRLKSDGGKATFIVVYAAGTVEDLERANGVEGFLDLILETADSVARF